MRVYQTNEIKNIALLGSAGSGKTTLAESMIYGSGIIKRRGTVEAKNTVSDYFPVEHEYGYSVFPTVFHVEWNNKKLNIIDCPGSDDFIGGAITALNVTDQAVILINGQYGPEVVHRTTSVIPKNFTSRLSSLSTSWILTSAISIMS